MPALRLLDKGSTLTKAKPNQMSATYLMNLKTTKSETLLQDIKVRVQETFCGPFLITLNQKWKIYQNFAYCLRHMHNEKLRCEYLYLR